MPSALDRARWWGEWGLVFAFIILGVCLLIVPPSVGMADNGDFERLMWQVGIDYPPGVTPERYSAVRFHFVRADTSAKVHRVDPVTVVALLPPVALAIGLNNLARTPGFDLRWLGFVQIALLGGVLAVWLRWTRGQRPWVRGIFAAALLLLLGDMGFLLYDNSFYAEPTSRLYFLLAIGSLLNFQTGTGVGRGGRAGWLGLFFLSALLFSLSKGQNGPLILPLVGVGVFAAGVDGRRWVKRASIVAAAASLAVGAYAMGHYDRQTLQVNQYHTFFGCILPRSPTPAQDLAEFGLPPGMQSLADPDQVKTPLRTPEFDATFFPRVGPGKFARYYLRHPRRLMDELSFVCARITDVRPTYLTNFEQASGGHAWRVNEIPAPSYLPSGDRWKWYIWTLFSLWSTLKEASVPATAWFWLAWGGLHLGVGTYQAIAGPSPATRITGALRIGLGAMFLVIPLIVLIGDGECELRKHLFPEAMTFDVMALLALMDVLRWFASRGRTAAHGAQSTSAAPAI